MASLRLGLKVCVSNASFAFKTQTQTASKLFLNASNNATLLQMRTIARKDHLDPEVVAAKPKPWPYETKKYSVFHEILRLDYPTTSRFDENTKIITIDGPVAVGKEKFAKQLADLLGMKFIPEPDLDDLFIDDRGFDYRCLNRLLPESAQFFDVKMLHINPYHIGINTLAWIYIIRRSYDYLDALAHLYNTGQGVVILRNPWSDLVFAESLAKHGFLYKDTLDFYHRVRKNTLWEYQRPHVCIYLDISPELSLQKIRAKNNFESKSKVFNLEFLRTFEEQYKTLYLPEISRHAELLVYDWSNEGDMDLVIEDLEKIDFDKYEMFGEKMEDWRWFPEEHWDEFRRKYTNTKGKLIAHFFLPTYDVEGLYMTTDVAKIRREIIETYVPNYYDEGFDPSVESWWKLLFKGDGNYREKQNNRWNIVKNVRFDD
ncbi:NADH dehydrogenase [ubiquinone] 1 alpha subcomplex subunit 10-like protein [Dinothrombium tinctorium]|uniref:NADH dehydrogenase [ubiquinone] 1 alpha subcomplex subunit 10, mitochondrial n=1 Tax=Dinothrombium tinctorium TaxID=1965070 RepID=A0A443RHZ8_9ACAR|nr:NADH dehydrogenase [ubiquinone] 1 alpha subcomplex subunit 10-like protein [Dinothrombium tinctorium]RWS14878.1 NADH dehydrogenase [ubiquinone] 1 alpha subcomplex subunit 10-like protein [Dinothrombium tinctorium]